MIALRPQAQVILNHLENIGSITQLQATERYRFTRLAAIVFDMHAAGIPVISEMVYTRNSDGDPVKYAVYRLDKPKWKAVKATSAAQS